MEERTAFLQQRVKQERLEKLCNLLHIAVRAKKAIRKKSSQIQLCKFNS